MKFTLFVFNILFVCISFAQDKPVTDKETQIKKDIVKKAVGYLPNETRKAEELITPLLKKSIQENDDEFIAKGYLAMGLINLYDSHYYLSNEYYTKALATGYARKTRKFASACYSNRGGNFIYLNNLPAAIKDLNQSLKIAEKAGDSIDYYQTLGNIGFLDGQSRNFAEAEKKTRKALAYFKRMNMPGEIPRHYQNLAMFYKDEDKLPQALENANMALKLYKDDDQNKVKVYYIIAETYYKLGNIAASNETLKQAMDIVNASGQQMSVLTQIYYQMARNDLSVNKFDKIEGYLQKAKELTVSAGVTETMDGYYLARWEYYARTGNFKAFKKNEEEYLEYMERKEKQQSTERYDELNAFYGTERKEARLTAQQQELKLKDTQLWALGLIILILAVAAGLISWYYIQMRRYIKSLYRSNLEEVATGPFAEIKEDITDRQSSLYNSLLKLMEEEKLYLQPDLNISDLSARTGSNDKYISQAINNFSNGNFNSFLNRYRINHAKKRIIESGGTMSLKIVSAESGFNNHTTFYRQFKEITGLTPTQFTDMSRQPVNDDRISA